MSVMPHNHEMSAVIGIYTGREDNIFWRRLPQDAKGVLNPVRRLTGAIHVYGGDFLRSEWDPEALVEQPCNLETTLALFEESNRLSPAS